MAREFLGRGLPFPLVPDERGSLSYTEGSENIAHSLRVLLSTELGERVMRPGFGCDAARYLFAPGSETNLRLLEQVVKRALIEHEPRVDVLDVAAERDPRSETSVIVRLSYRERRTNTVGNLVFPYYLGAGVER